jgi:agmatinase
MKNHVWGSPEGFLGIEESRKAEFSVLPVPFDSTASYRSGARLGPAAIIEASKQVELFDIESGKEIVPAVETLRFMEVARANPEENCRRVGEVVAGILKEGKIPVTLGGDHSVSIGAIAQFPKEVVVVSIDAHGDLRDEYEGGKFSHACVMKRAFDSGKRIVALGVRAISKEESELIKKNPGKITLIGKAEIEKLAKELKGKKVYLTIDIDGFNPKEAPGTGTPEPGGLSYKDGLEIIKIIAKNSKIVGFDVVEVAPTGTDNVTEFLAARLLTRIMALVG